jgi:hypothetical protein
MGGDTARLAACIDRVRAVLPTGEDMVGHVGASIAGRSGWAVPLMLEPARVVPPALPPVAGAGGQ